MVDYIELVKEKTNSSKRQINDDSPHIIHLSIAKLEKDTLL